MNKDNFSKIGNLIENSLVNHQRLILILLLFGYFSKSLMSGLINGGRWDLYQQIAMADRFLAGHGLYYSSIEASSPYFPGVSFLSIIVSQFAFSYRDYILLVAASAVGTCFFYMLISLGEKFSGNKTIAMITISVLLFTGFEHYRSYMSEFKADSFVLLCSIAIMFVIEKLEREKYSGRIFPLLFVMGMAFIMDITKQQAVYLNVSIIGYLLFISSAAWKSRLALCAAIICSGIVSLLLLFSIPGIEIQTIDNLKDMPYWSLKDIIYQMGGTFRSHKLYFLLCLYFSYLCIAKKIVLSSLGKKWLCIAVLFCAAQIVGGWKLGGNSGNYQVGMVTLVPFAAVAASRMYESLIAESKKKIVVVFGLFVCFVLSGMFLASSAYKIPKQLIPKFQENAAISEYLSANCHNEVIMYYSNQYMIISRSSAIPGMDIYSTPSNSQKYWNTRAEMLNKKVYKYLYIEPENLKHWDDSTEKYFGYNPLSMKALKDNYQMIEDDNMPKELQGKLFEVKQVQHDK